MEQIFKIFTDNNISFRYNADKTIHLSTNTILNDVVLVQLLNQKLVSITNGSYGSTLIFAE